MLGNAIMRGIRAAGAAPAAKTIYGFPAALGLHFDETSGSVFSEVTAKTPTVTGTVVGETT